MTTPHMQSPNSGKSYGQFGSKAKNVYVEQSPQMQERMESQERFASMKTEAELLGDKDFLATLQGDTEFSGSRKDGDHYTLKNKGGMMTPIMTEDEALNQRREMLRNETQQAFNRECDARDEELRWRTLTPSQKRDEVERKYIPIVKAAYDAVYEAKGAIDAYIDDELPACIRGSVKRVYVDYSMPEYNRVVCYGKYHYENTLLKDDDLQDNYREIHRTTPLQGGSTFVIYYLPRGVTQKDLEPKALEMERAAYVSGRPSLERKFDAAYANAKAMRDEFDRALSAIETADFVLKNQFKSLSDFYRKNKSSKEDINETTED